MCFDCLLAFPLFSSSPQAGAKKTLLKLSRPNTPAPTEADAPYGPPLKHDLNPEDLPVASENGSKGAQPIDDGDSGNYHPQEGAENDSMDPSTGMELDAVVLVDMDGAALGNHKESPPLETKQNHDESTPSDEKYVYEQEVEIEIETSLDEQLPIGSGDSSNTTDNTNDTMSTLQSTQKLLGHATTVTDGEKKTDQQPKVIGHLEVNLEYDEAGGRLKVAIMKASDLPNKQQGGFNNYRVRLSLRPKKQQSSKTRIRPVDDLVFRELFRFRQLPKEELPILELLFKMHGCGKYGKEKLVSDAILNLSALKAAAKQNFNIPLLEALPREKSKSGTENS
ncbi:uncharacterized protein [Amphiura filiformis]|uniref:uncharacterized protein n=1 Tax=Amphiura filiformis TaxID=82378 RepID=UPI003B21E3AB